jgi:hypothetical protein
MPSMPYTLAIKFVCTIIGERKNSAEMDISFSLSATDSFFFSAVWFHTVVYMLQSKHWLSGDTAVCTCKKKGHTTTAGVFD